jgi:mono/diheme cytochrome c family protein
VRLPRHTAAAAVAALVIVPAALLGSGCGREHEPDLVNGKALYIQKCGSCHVLARANAQGTTGPNLDEAFDAAYEDGMNEATVRGVVQDQIANVRRSSQMPPNLVTGNDAIDVAAYVAAVAGRRGQDTGALASAGLAQANTGEQIFQAAGCASCHRLAKAGATGTVGPSLEDLASAAGQREPGKSPEDYLRESIVEPDAFTVQGFQQGAMPAFDQLDDEQLKMLVDYLLGRGE